MNHLKRLNELLEGKRVDTSKKTGELKHRTIKKIDLVEKEKNSSKESITVKPVIPELLEKTSVKEDKGYVPIKKWANDDRPREKLRAKGKHALSNAELIAILIGSGSRSTSAVDLAKEILQSAENNLNELGKISIDELIKNFHGIGEAKAITITAALELGRRRQMSDIKERPHIRSSQDAYNAIAPMLIDLQHEEFWILMLNRGNQVLKRVQISQGGVAGTVVDAKIIFKRALEIPASALVLCHNHPSGNLRPSGADIEITKKIKAGAELIDINVLDHLIVSERGYFSFADEGMM